MADFRHTVVLPRPPEEVFRWLLDADKVPRWTERLEAYEVAGGGPVGEGSRIRQVFTVSGQRIEVDMEVVRHDPPRRAECRFSVQGVDVETVYVVTLAPGGAELTQTLEGRASSFKARMLLPVVRPKLESKLEQDLERLREVLSAE